MPIHGSALARLSQVHSKVRTEIATRLFLRLGNIMRTYAEDAFVQNRNKLPIRSAVTVAATVRTCEPDRWLLEPRLTPFCLVFQHKSGTCHACGVEREYPGLDQKALVPPAGRTKGKPPETSTTVKFVSKSSPKTASLASAATSGTPLPLEMPATPSW